MANKHLKELMLRTRDYFSQLSSLDSEVVRVSSNTMVDPSEWGEIVSKLRTLSLHLSNINSVLNLAYSVPDDFKSALSSRRNLIRAVESTLDRVKIEQPDSELIDSYKKVLISHYEALGLLEETDRFRGFPKSKKKFNHLKNKNSVDLNYKPFIEVEKSLSLLKTEISGGPDEV